MSDAARVRMCRAKGFDAVDFDNVDGYTNRTGFALTGADQLAFNTYLAGLAHRENVNALVKHLSLDAWQVACR